METHQKNDELIDNVTPDGECEDQLESWGLAVTTHEARNYWFWTKWTNERINQWLQEIFPQVFCYDMVYLRKNNTGIFSRVAKIV